MIIIVSKPWADISPPPLTSEQKTIGAQEGDNIFLLILMLVF